MPLFLDDPIGSPRRDARIIAINNRRPREFVNGPDPFAQCVLKSLVDAKGDLLVGTAADTLARLAVGSNGQGLVAASGETNGLKWTATPECQ